MNCRKFLASSALAGGALVVGMLTAGRAGAQGTPTSGGTLIWGHSETV